MKNLEKKSDNQLPIYGQKPIYNMATIWHLEPWNVHFWSCHVPNVRL